MNKIFKALSIFILIVIISAIGVFYYFDSNMCENTEIIRTPSPDKKLYAVLFERSCGATTGFSTQISLINSNKSIENNEVGNIYIANGYPDNYSFNWLSPYVLNIRGTKTNALKKVSLYNSVTITYE